MELQRIEGTSAARITGKGMLLAEAGDGMDILSECMSAGVDAAIIPSETVSPGFVALRTGLAGEVLQKFTTYRVRLAITGNYSEVVSKSLRDFVRESNRQGNMLFVADEAEALSVWGMRA